MAFLSFFVNEKTYNRLLKYPSVYGQQIFSCQLSRLSVNWNSVFSIFEINFFMVSVVSFARKEIDLQGRLLLQ